MIHDLALIVDRWRFFRLSVPAWADLQLRDRWGRWGEKEGKRAESPRLRHALRFASLRRRWALVDLEYAKMVADPALQESNILQRLGRIPVVVL